MGLTQVSTDGVKNDAITKTKIPANQIEASELADNAVDTNAIADQAVSLSKLPHGTSSNDGKFLRANNGADPTFETVNTDLVADTSPQLGGALDVNGNDIKSGTAIYEIVTNTRHNFKAGGNTIVDINANGVDFKAGNNTHADNVKSQFGTGNDLKIFHDGSNSKLTHDGSGGLYIGADTFVLQKGDHSENYISMAANGAVELYHNNTKRVSTSGSGIQLDNVPDNHFIILDQGGRQHSFNTYFSSGSTNSRIGIDISNGNINGTKTRSVDFWPNGMSFNGDTADANKLDDYEEGTFTPAVTSGLSGGQIAYNSRSGKYTKVGNTVTFTFHMNISSASLDSGGLKFGGLPFTSANVSHTAGGMWRIFTTGNISASASYKVVGNATDIAVITHAGDAQAANGTSIANGGRQFAYWGFYYIS